MWLLLPFSSSKVLITSELDLKSISKLELNIEIDQISLLVTVLAMPGQIVVMIGYVATPRCYKFKNI